MKIKQHSPEQPMDQRRNYRRNLRSLLRQMKVKTRIYGMQQKQFLEGQHSNGYLQKEAEKILNKQPNSMP